MPKQKSTHRVIALLTALVAATSASGASAANLDGNYAPVLGDAPATRNPTAYSAALSCLASHRSNTRLPRISVGRVSDLTGKVDFDTGAKISQGASLFAITALTKAGFPVVERLDNSVAEIELNYSRQHLLSDNPQLAGQSPDNYRRIYAGQIAGSSYYIVGGVTEPAIYGTGFKYTRSLAGMAGGGFIGGALAGAAIGGASGAIIGSATSPYRRGGYYYDDGYYGGCPYGYYRDRWGQLYCR